VGAVPGSGRLLIRGLLGRRPLDRGAIKIGEVGEVGHELSVPESVNAVGGPTEGTAGLPWDAGGGSTNHCREVRPGARFLPCTGAWPAGLFRGYRITNKRRRRGKLLGGIRLPVSSPGEIRPIRGPQRVDGFKRGDGRCHRRRGKLERHTSRSTPLNEIVKPRRSKDR